MFLATMAVCFYIGYFGAGAGFLLITVLSLFGFQDLHEINALKVVSTTWPTARRDYLRRVRQTKWVWPYSMVAMVVAAIGGLFLWPAWLGRVPSPVLRAWSFLSAFSMAERVLLGGSSKDDHANTMSPDPLTTTRPMSTKASALRRPNDQQAARTRPSALCLASAYPEKFRVLHHRGQGHGDRLDRRPQERLELCMAALAPVRAHLRRRA